MAASSSTVATLVLALQARNETRAGFDAVRRDLAEQTEAARRAAAEQTLAVRQATQQQLLEIRQRTAAEALALRQSVAGQALATRQAMEQRIQMLRQDAEQTALLAREGARAQIEAITLTRDADIRAARERATAAEQMLRTQENAARIAAASEAAAAREAGGGVLVGAGREREPGGGLLESMGRFGAQMVLWNVGYAAVNRVTEAVGGLAGGLVTANSRMEQFHQTFQAIYGSGAAADQATAYLTHFAITTPDTREHVMAAGETISSLGLDVTQVMPALGNVAAVMGKDMPTAAQAFADAYEGRFQMLAMSLHITKGQLIEFGMQVDKSGHVLNNSFVPAFERLAAAKFGHGMDLQMKTAAGVFSNVQDNIENLQRVMGAPMFALIKKDLADFMTLLSSPKALGFAQVIGTGLGNAFHAMSDAVRAAAPVVMGAITMIVAAWGAASPFIQTAINALKGAMATIGTFLQQNVLPVVQQALGQIVLWWGQNKQQVSTILGAIIAIVTTWAGTLQQRLADTLNVLHGLWDVGWSLISGSFSLVLDVVTGNWRKFGNDLNTMATGIAIGVLEIFRGLVDNVITLVSHLADPINALLHGVYDVSRALAGAIFDTWNNLPEMVMGAVQRLLKSLPTIGRLIGGWFADLSAAIHHAQHGERFHLSEEAGPGAGGHTLVQQAHADARTARQRFVDTMTFGLGPDQTFTFKVDAGAAQATFDGQVAAWEDQLRKSPNLFTGAPSTYGTPAQQRQAGKDFLTQLNTWLKAHRLTLPGLPAAGGGPGGTGTDLLATDTQPFDPRSASAAQQAALGAAETRFQLDLARGTITQAQGLRDIAAIVAAQRAGGASHDQQLLTALQDTRTLDAQLLDQARKHFDFDAGVAHPSRLRLHQDELAMLKIMAQTPGLTPIDLATARQDLDKRIDQIVGGHPAAARPIAPYKQAAFDLARGAGYGQTTVTMGPVRDQLIAQLQAQLRELKAQNVGQQKQIAALEAQLVELHRASGLLDGIFHNTAGTHQATQQTARHTQPRPTSGAHGFSQRTGMPVPV